MYKSTKQHWNFINLQSVCPLQIILGVNTSNLLWIEADNRIIEIFRIHIQLPSGYVV